MNPPSQSSIEALHTITIYIERERKEMNPLVNDHRGIAYHDTAYIYIEEGDESPGQLITEALHTTTLLIHKYRKEITPPGQSSIEALHIITLHIYIEREREEGD